MFKNAHLDLWVKPGHGISTATEQERTPRGHQVRQTKSQGINKIGTQCTIPIKAKLNEDTGCVDVTYCGTHTHAIRLYPTSAFLNKQG